MQVETQQSMKNNQRIMLNMPRGTTIPDSKLYFRAILTKTASY